MNFASLVRFDKLTTENIVFNKLLSDVGSDTGGNGACASFVAAAGKLSIAERERDGSFQYCCFMNVIFRTKLIITRFIIIIIILKQ